MGYQLCSLWGPKLRKRLNFVTKNGMLNVMVLKYLIIFFKGKFSYQISRYISVRRNILRWIEIPVTDL